MSRWLALLSGKGGSGKTTLALSIASMLSDCGVKVLLIDCDLSTNGATYFYEDRLTEYGGAADSFYRELFNPFHDRQDRLININENMDFMPSIIQIATENTKSYAYNESDRKILPVLKNNYNDKYDVVLLDCQAGYTDILKLILPIVDINLLVMEADAISSSAIRSLYLKIGDYLDKTKVYQVFNKATEEEYEIYSKLSGGTVFTNIETVMFDWKIRKAFSVAKIPDMKNTSANYGEQIYNICSILFKDKSIQNKLSKYKVIMQLNNNEQEAEEIKQKISILQEARGKTKNRSYRIILYSAFGLFLMMLNIIFYGITKRKVFSDYPVDTFSMTMIFLMLITVMSVFVMMTMDSVRDRNSNYKEIEMYRKQLKTILADQQKLQEKYHACYKDRE